MGSNIEKVLVTITVEPITGWRLSADFRAELLTHNIICHEVLIGDPKRAERLEEFRILPEDDRCFLLLERKVMDATGALTLRFVANNLALPLGGLGGEVIWLPRQVLASV